MKPVSLTQKTGKLSNGFKFLIVIVCGGAALLLFGALFMFWERNASLCRM